MFFFFFLSSEIVVCLFIKIFQAILTEVRFCIELHDVLPLHVLQGCDRF